MISILNTIKGHNSVKSVKGDMVLFLCNLSDDDFIFVPFNLKISQRVSEFFSGHDFNTEIYKGVTLKFSKEYNSVKCTWSYTTFFCTSSDNILYDY